MIRNDFSVSRRAVLMGGGAAVLGASFPFSVSAAEPIKMAGIYTVPVEQQWVSRIHKAAEAAKAAGAVTYKYTENVANTDYPRVMREYCESGVKLIVGEIFGAEAEAREVAAEYPGVAFLLGSSFMPDEKANPNLAVFDNYIQDASYLSGIIAGAMTKSGNIGMVGGFPIPEVNRLMNAFMAGVRESRADAKFQVSFIGSWFDPPKAKETAFAMISEVVERALSFTRKKELLVVGGVAANKRLSEMLQDVCKRHGCKFFVAPQKYAGDCGSQICWTGLLESQVKKGVSLEETFVTQSWRLDSVKVDY
jgi:basic membrane lipoprotein Med (substrate-binding protein (PBP1-ABC) superfamily)